MVPRKRKIEQQGGYRIRHTISHDNERGKIIMSTRICCICGREKLSRDFGDGISIPKTTCLECYRKNKELQKPKKEKKVNPVKEFLKELKNEIHLH